MPTLVLHNEGRPPDTGPGPRVFVPCGWDGPAWLRPGVVVLEHCGCYQPAQVVFVCHSQLDSQCATNWPLGRGPTTVHGPSVARSALPIADELLLELADARLARALEDTGLCLHSPRRDGGSMANPVVASLLAGTAVCSGSQVQLDCLGKSLKLRVAEARAAASAAAAPAAVVPPVSAAAGSAFAAKVAATAAGAKGGGENGAVPPVLVISPLTTVSFVLSRGSGGANGRDKGGNQSSIHQRWLRAVLRRVGGMTSAVVAPLVELAVAALLPLPRLADSDDEALVARGALVYGPSGCGKSALLSALASPVEGGSEGDGGTRTDGSGGRLLGPSGSAILADASSLLRRDVGESESAVRRLFARARREQPCLVLLDGIDALRDGGGVSPGKEGGTGGEEGRETRLNQEEMETRGAENEATVHPKHTVLYICQSSLTRSLACLFVHATPISFSCGGCIVARHASSRRAHLARAGQEVTAPP